MAETEAKQIYYGNCHCGGFKFSVALAPIQKASVCNCSICSRVRATHIIRYISQLAVSDLNLQKGYLFAVPEKPSDFKVEAGEGTLKTYSFGKGVAEHKVSSFRFTNKSRIFLTYIVLSNMWLWYSGRSSQAEFPRCQCNWPSYYRQLSQSNECSRSTCSSMAQ